MADLTEFDVIAIVAPGRLKTKGPSKLMGKRNLAIAGTQEDFFADILDNNTGDDPPIVAGCASPEDAATSYFKNIFENSNGRVRSAVVAVWTVAAGREKQLVFEAKTVMTPCEEPDAELGDFNVFLDVRERL